MNLKFSQLFERSLKYGPRFIIMKNRLCVSLGLLLSLTLPIIGNTYVSDEVLVISKRQNFLKSATTYSRNIADDASVKSIDHPMITEDTSPSGFSIHNKKGGPRKYLSTHSVRSVKLRAGADPAEFSKRWRSGGKIDGEEIQYVQPNYIYSIREVAVNDPLPNQGNNFIKITDTNKAWDITQGTTNVVIAVIDTGTRTTHEDLSHALWINKNETAGNGIDDDQNGYIDDVNGANTGVLNGSSNSGNVTDDQGHGSHVAGIIVAKLNNNKGMAGVCPNCKLMTLKANRPNWGEFFTSSLISAIKYATDMGASIINMSLGGPPDSNDYLWREAIQNATAAGVVAVAAAGNEKQNLSVYPSNPASFPEVIAVSATDGDIFDSSYSNYGTDIFVAAPGTDITSTGYLTDSQYFAISGTSMASPVVAGVIGLMKSRQPRLTSGNIKTLLQTYSVDKGTPGKDNYYGYGLVNANNVLQAIHSDTQPPTLTLISAPDKVSENAVVTIQIGLADNNVVSPSTLVTANYYRNSTLVATQNPAAVRGSGNNYFIYAASANSQITHVIISVSAIDIADNTATLPDIQVKLNDIEAPVVSTPSSYVDDQLSGTITLTLTDSSNIVTNSIRVRYSGETTSETKTTISNPDVVSFAANRLAIQLASIGYTPSISATLEVYSTDSLGNAATRSIGIGSTSTPSITIQNHRNDYVDTGTQLRWLITDPIGVSTNSLILTLQSTTQSVTRTYKDTPDRFIVSLPAVAYSLQQSEVPFNTTFNSVISVKNRLFGVSTASFELKTRGNTPTEPTESVRSKLLANPNPFDPRKENVKIAYSLNKNAVSGTLFIYDLSYKKIRTKNVDTQFLLAGYNEFFWDGTDDFGSTVPNGTYIALMTIIDNSETIKLRQKIAVLKE